MAGLLISQAALGQCAQRLAELEQQHTVQLEPILLPAQPGEPLGAQSCERIQIALLSTDVFAAGRAREFFALLAGAPRLRWLHSASAGTDSALYDGVLASGVTLTHSAGTAARPIALSALGGLLILARGFLHWQAGQRERAWRRLGPEAAAEDLDGQRLTVFGLGQIGLELARLARALGLHVTGIRRSPPPPGAAIDAWLPPERLHEALPGTHWLALCAALTPHTRGAIGARELALLPRGARLLNVARGELAVESELIAALRSGQLGGAYLDVFEREPLPADSPLWELPNVIVSPHNSAHSRGNATRVAELFTRNLERWLRKEPLQNAVDPHER